MKTLKYKFLIFAISDSGYVLATKDNNIPEHEVDFENIKSANNVLADLVNLNANWLQLKIVDVIISQDLTDIYYTTLIPETFVLNDLEWTPIHEIKNNEKLDKQVKEMVSQGINRHY